MTYLSEWLGLTMAPLDRLTIKFSALLHSVGLFTRSCFDVIDRYRKKGMQEITISHDAWNTFPTKVRNNFVMYFNIYLIVKYNKHYRAIDYRAFDIVREDEHGKIFRLKCDSEEGWFNNGSN